MESLESPEAAAVRAVRGCYRLLLLSEPSETAAVCCCFQSCQRLLLFAAAVGAVRDCCCLLLLSELSEAAAVLLLSEPSEAHRGSYHLLLLLELSEAAAVRPQPSGKSCTSVLFCTGASSVRSRPRGLCA